MTAAVTVDERDALRAELEALGFARVRFASADPVDARRLDEWLAAGRQASMDYMARHAALRPDPDALLPGARSVICVAVAYPPTDARGPIAGYARAEDYHHTIRAALERGVARLVERFPDVRTRICVDSAPLLERAFAERAGVGWIGRNTMVLDEEHGPWLLLAEVLVDLTFPPDEPVVARCGTCTACIDACPTQALDVVTGLDANRCLSYWTIEHRGDLPDEIAAALDERVFGCDDCLTACPFGRDAPAPPEDGPWIGRDDLVSPSLDDLAARADASFKRHFGSTPIERARKGGLQRNLAAARAAARRSDANRPPPR